MARRDITSKNSWEEIEEAWRNIDEGSLRYSSLKSVYNVKLAKENINNSRKMVFSTYLLAIFTFMLFLITSINLYMTHLAYEEGKKQAVVVESLSKSMKNMNHTMRSLTSITNKQTDAMENVSVSLDELRKTIFRMGPGLK